MIVPRSHIKSMAAYALADLNASTSAEVISLSQNESFRPHSPKIVDAIQKVVPQARLYPDPDWTELREKLAVTHSIPSQLILCGNGSLELIAAIASVYAGPNRAVLIPQHAYPFFRTAAALSGARIDAAPENDATACVLAILDAVRPDTGLVFIANPGNPTGTRLAKEQLLMLRRELRDDILLVVDEAYGEFADHMNERCFDMIDSGDTVVLRTFSKAYGMAGYRVGWGLFPDPIQREIRKSLNPNNVSMLSQVAAVAALEDQEYMHETCDVTIELRDQASDRLRTAGFKVYPSFTNFILIDCESASNADELEMHLRNEGILVRKQSGAGLPNALRMTVGSEEAIDRCLRSMIKWRKSIC